MGERIAFVPLRVSSGVFQGLNFTNISDIYLLKFKSGVCILSLGTHFEAGRDLLLGLTPYSANFIYYATDFFYIAYEFVTYPYNVSFGNIRLQFSLCH